MRLSFMKTSRCVWGRRLSQKSFQCCCILALAAVTSLLGVKPVRAGGTVTACTEAALQAATAGGGTVTFSCDGTITLTQPIWTLTNTVLDGSGHQVTISGGGSVQVFYVAMGSLTLIHLTISNGQTSSGTNGMYFYPGYATAGGTGNPGGGIYNAGTLILRDCVVTANSTGNGGLGYSGVYGSYLYSLGGSGGSGGGIYNAGTLSLSNCIVSGNSTGYGSASGGSAPDDYHPVGGHGGFGAGICNAGTLCLVNTTVSGNRTGRGADDPSGSSGATGGDGGGIWSSGNLAANGCTFSGNSTGAGGAGGNGQFQGGSGGTGGSGGALCGTGYFALTNCTVAGNSTGAGGAGGGPKGGSADGNAGQGGFGAGIYGQTNFDLVSCTIASNRTGSGGLGCAGQAGPAGLGGGVAVANGAARLLNTIVALNTGAQPDLWGAFLSLGNNLIGATNGSSGLPGAEDQVGSGASPLNPQVGPLANNGGPTFTLALLPGSPALDAGTATGIPPTDQRGVARPQGAGVDIGAFEYQYTVPVISGAAFQGPNFWLHCCALPGSAYTVQVSTNLLNWADLVCIGSGANGFFECVDAAQINCAKRFYRLRYTAP